MSKNFYTLDLINISQLITGTGAIFTGKIQFGQLLTIHRLTERKESIIDPFNEKGIVEDLDKVEDEEFQRHLNPGKLNEIKKYIGSELKEKNIGALFPSSVILSLEINENSNEEITEDEIESFYHEKLNSCFLINSPNGFKKLYIPKNSRICLIVDGQHRFYGFKKYYEAEQDIEEKEKVSQFEFITTIILGFDPYQVAEVFANVNFYQKPVNRSLYYDIFGTSANERNDIQLAHFLALHLQNNSDSPLQDMIKLLGKGFGLFSQAFIVEKLLIHFKGGVWGDLFLDYQNNGKEYLKIPEFIKAYFNSIEKNYNSCGQLE